VSVPAPSTAPVSCDEKTVARNRRIVAHGPSSSRSDDWTDDRRRAVGEVVCAHKRRRRALYKIAKKEKLRDR
jgi:hypothetical protein